MDKLMQAREAIGAIDKEIAALFEQRMNAVRLVSEYKIEHGLPIYDAAREDALIAKNTAMIGDEELRSYYVDFLRNTMRVSRNFQAKLSEGMRVAFSGVEGAFASIAAGKIFDRCVRVPFHDFRSAYHAVVSGDCDCAVLPIENSTAGSVKKVYELMLHHNFHIVRSVRIKIDHNLLARRGAKLENIREIVSHEQAINQCSSFLRSLGDIKITIAPNTALAAKMVAESGRDDIAALSSRFCAELYGLETLSEAVQDMGNNHTRFICISKDAEIYPGADKLTLMLVTPNKPGALYNVLSCFNALGVNMTKLESCPIPERDFESMFYFDFTVSVYSNNLERLLCELEARGERYKLLGAYSEII